MLTDTTFWIDLARERAQDQRGPASAFLAQNRAHTLEVSIITWGELAVGFDSPEQVNRWLRQVRVLLLHAHVAWEASRIERHLARAGARLGENDNWIAATARAWGLRLVSRDGAFDRVPDLHRVPY